MPLDDLVVVLQNIYDEGYSQGGKDANGIPLGVIKNKLLQQPGFGENRTKLVLSILEELGMEESSNGKRKSANKTRNNK